MRSVHHNSSCYRSAAGRFVALVAGGAMLAALVAGSAAAQEQTAARKVGRGLAGMTCGFLEVPGNVVAENRARGPAWGFSYGFAIGLGKLVVRELVGVYEFVTAPFPIPEGFQPILKPEYPWDYFDQGYGAAPSN